MNKTESHLISREIGIDMGHRVTFHGSKCRNLHGHRYTIRAICSGPLFLEGEQRGMVLDFGFLKEEMMCHIDEPCDHGMCIWWEDPILPTLVGNTSTLNGLDRSRAAEVHADTGKMYIVPFVPTAENLARHWFNRLEPSVRERSEDKARLVQIKVWETPNCTASYPAEMNHAT